MKKVLIFTLSFLLLANIVAAANKPSKVLMATTVGVVKSIDMNNQSFVMEKTGLMKFFYALLGALKFQAPRSTDITVITTTETEFKKKTTEGVASGAFTDLAVGQRVQVKGSYLKESTTTKTSLKATNVFILTPVQVALKECQTDADCTWCGNTCVEKNTLKNRMCAQVMPPEGYDCKCVLDHDCPGVIPVTITSADGHVTTLPSCGHCKKVLRSGPSTTHPATSTSEIIDKTCQEACIAQGYTNGICRQWAVTAQAKFGCNLNETEIGQTKDCTTIVNGHSLLGIGKTCCCK
ncbi:MAG: hypothetical protein GYA31_02415 [Parcubacteria group bacterium]|nr:hypothetical protein [Parcubacteria group bacterium]